MIKSNYFVLLVALFCLITVSCNNIDKKNDSIQDGDNFQKIVVEDIDDAYQFFSWTEDRIPMVSAHRGGRYYEGYTENTIDVFEYVIRHNPAIIEFDVSKCKDGELILMHDETTARTATEDKAVRDLTFEEIRNLTLVDYKRNVVKGTVPTLKEVLEWGKGKVVYTVDVKSVDYLDEVAQMIIETGAESYSAIITYTLNVAESIHQKYPNLMLSVTVRNQDELERLLNSSINLNNVVAFTGTSARDKSFNDSLHELGIFTILGTMGNIDNSAKARGENVYSDVVANGADILSTDYPVEAYNAFKSLVPEKSSKSIFFKVDGE